MNLDSDDESSGDDDLGRNMHASPIIGMKDPRGKKNMMVNNNKRFAPKMSEVVEETEPESSFKETDKFKKKKRNNNSRSRSPISSSIVPNTVPEESPLAESESQTSFVAPPDREDDFSDESEPEDQKP